MKNFVAQNVDIYNPKRQLKYAKMFDNIESLFPVRETEIGNPLTIEDAADYPNQGILVEGKTSQNGTPTMANPIAIQNVSGDVAVIITNADSNLSQSVIFPLEQGQNLCKGDYLADDGIHHKYRFKTWNTAYLITGIRKATDTRFILDVANHKIWGNVFSNYFSNDTSNRMYITGSNSTGQLWLYDKDGVFEGNVRNLKDFFTDRNNDGTPVETVYECGDELIESYTSAQQIAWNQIKKLSMYKGGTNILASSDDLSPDLKVAYIQDLDYRLNQIEQAIIARDSNS